MAFPSTFICLDGMQTSIKTNENSASLYLCLALFWAHRKVSGHHNWFCVTVIDYLARTWMAWSGGCWEITELCHRVPDRRRQLNAQLIVQFRLKCHDNVAEDAGADATLMAGKGILARGSLESGNLICPSFSSDIRQEYGAQKESPSTSTVFAFATRAASG